MGWRARSLTTAIAQVSSQWATFHQQLSQTTQWATFHQRLDRPLNHSHPKSYVGKAPGRNEAKETNSSLSLGSRKCILQRLNAEK